MAEVTAFALSKMFSQLTGRAVACTLVLKPAPLKTKPLYGVYSIAPDNSALIVRSELGLIGLFGGALLGLPNDSVLERVKENPLEEVLRDAMYEVLNISSTAISPDRRAVFENMYTDPVYFSQAAQQVFNAPFHTTQFSVKIDDFTGDFAVLSGA